MLKNLLNFDDCTSVSEIETRFLTISETIFSNYLIFSKLTKTYFIITKLELFIDNPEANSSDSFIHGNEQQMDSGTWYIHQEKNSKKLKTPQFIGTSITCGRKNQYYASIKIDGLAELGASVEDCNLSLNEIIKNNIHGMVNVTFCLIKEKLEEHRSWEKNIEDLLLMINNSSVFDSNNSISLINFDNSLVCKTKIKAHRGVRNSVENLKDSKKTKNFNYATFSNLSPDYTKLLKNILR